MSRPPKYPQDKIDLVLSLLHRGNSEREVAKITGIPKSTVHRIGAKA